MLNNYKNKIKEACW